VKSVPTLLYGLQSWAKFNEQKCEQLQARKLVFKRIGNLYCSDMMGSEIVRKNLGLFSVEEKIQGYKLKGLQHVKMQYRICMRFGIKTTDK
jgi:hypothetical protein